MAFAVNAPDQIQKAITAPKGSVDHGMEQEIWW